MKLLLLITGQLLCSIGVSFGQAIPENSIEIVSKRDANSKTYQKSDGTLETIIAAGPIHYQSNGSWVPFDTKLIPSKSGDFAYENRENTLQSFFPENVSSASSLVLRFGGHELSIASTKKLVFAMENDVYPTEIGESSANPTASVDGNKLTYESIYAGISDEYIIENAMLKNNLILNNLPTIITGSTQDYFGFQEELILPEDWIIVPLEASQESIISTSLEIIDGQGERILMIPAPFIYEKENRSNDGSAPIIGKYMIDKQNGVWKLTTLVPISWLNDPTTTYPIVIDPTITYAGNQGGWMSVVTLVNNSAFVFIGVCCGNQEHRAWIKFPTAGIADNQCIGNVELELYINGVGGAANELSYINDMTGAMGPYAAVNAAVLTDMGDGLYTSATFGNVGTYGWYDLGPAADALLQAQLPIDWFQPAVIFDNEPSINWKRFTATSCNLRVTYSAPPCVLLPVELTNFEVTCKDGSAELDWTTASESNNDYFTIWKSDDGESYIELAKVDGAGNSQTAIDYSWRSANENELSAYYKLSQTDNDGKTEFFDAHSFENCGDIISVYADLEERIHVQGDAIQSIRLIDKLGRSLLTHKNETHSKEILLKASSFSSGLYTLSITLVTGEQITRSIYLN